MGFFTGKTVSLVGNAQSLFSQKCGDDIDSRDLVVRMNRAAPFFTHEWATVTHGKRTDAWFVWRFHEYQEHLSRLSLPGFIMQVAFYDDPPFDGECCLSYPAEMYIELYETLAEHDPSTGTAAIEYILRDRPKLLTLFGFDWKLSPTFTDTDEEKNTNVDTGGELHDFCREKSLFWSRFHPAGANLHSRDK